MKSLKKLSLVMAVGIVFSLPMATASAQAESPVFSYTKAEDVEYVKDGKAVANWGLRGETCSFLSTYAEDFYTGSYQYSVVSELDGGSSVSDAPSSALYSALQSMMKTEHKKINSYGETGYLFGYTDCERNDTATISSFYSAKNFNNKWDQGATWNREHTWPNSKSLDGKKDGDDSNDLMMLRPTLSGENSNRKNTAYGESAGYYDPGEAVRGDCARIVLYVYTRWGNTRYMWGSGGVMENVSVLLKWMEEDPVDTWEMGRNDAVESITGTRNVFVDYPEYAWLLFGEEVPENLSTPSGKMESETPNDPSEDTPDAPLECLHVFGEWVTVTEATESADGLRIRACLNCGEMEEEILPTQEGEANSPSFDMGKILSGCNASLGITAGLGLLTACAFVIMKKDK